MIGEPQLRFPEWLERSGLPAQLAEQAKSPAAWLLFRRLVEEDLRQNPGKPGPFEISLDELARLTGVAPKAARPLLGKLRKAGVLHFFLPETDEEAALFEFPAPLPTPIPVAQVRAADARWASLDDSDFRHATGDGPTASKPREVDDERLREIVDLYLNTVSMKLNNFIADELRLIASRHDLPLVRKAFARAREKEVQSLGWILREIRAEDRRAAARKAAKAAGEKPA